MKSESNTDERSSYGKLVPSLRSEDDVPEETSNQPVERLGRRGAPPRPGEDGKRNGKPTSPHILEVDNAQPVNHVVVLVVDDGLTSRK
jgi:hypothetical protein